MKRRFIPGLLFAGALLFLCRPARGEDAPVLPLQVVSTWSDLERTPPIAFAGVPIRLDYPSDNFLTRWWVNDKPFLPDNSAVIQKARAEAMQWSDEGMKEIEFKLLFHPERLGAKKGDKIGVQLLVCPYGWSYRMEQAAQEAMDELPRRSADDVSRVSPRIDFVYSGDPKTPQQN